MTATEPAMPITTDEIAADLLRAMAAANERELASMPPRDASRGKSVASELAREVRAKLLLAHAIIEGAGIDAKHTHSLFVDFSGTNLGEVMIQAQHDGPRNASKVMLRIPGIAAGIRAAITKYLRAEIQG